LSRDSRGSCNRSIHKSIAKPLHRCRAADWAQREERIENALIGEIELSLKAVEKFVQAAADDLLYVGVGQLGAKLAEALLGKIAIHTHGCSGNFVQGVIGRRQTVMDRAGKFMIEDKKLDDVVGRDVAVALTIHSRALADRSTAAHWMSSGGVPTSVIDGSKI
jgi:hypothetical protein